MSVTMTRTVPDINRSARMAIYTQTGTITFLAPLAPPVIDYGGFEAAYVVTERPDRKPLHNRSGYSLRTMSFALELFTTGSNGRIFGDVPLNSQNYRLKQLEDLAKSTIPLIVEYEPRTRGLWRMSGLSYSSVQRDPVTNEITQATANLSFTEAPTKQQPSINNIDRPRKIAVKQGDTLSKIASRYYGTTSSYIVRAIAKANDIQNVRHLPKAITLP